MRLRKTVCWILLIELLCVLTLCVFIRGDSAYFDPNTPDTGRKAHESGYDENNIIFDWEAGFLREGMTYDQVIRILGKANRNIGSTFRIFEYACVSGRKLWVGLGFESGNPDWYVNNILWSGEVNWTPFAVTVAAFVGINACLLWLLIRKPKKEK